jgi:hypothetical protein
MAYFFPNRTGPVERRASFTAPSLIAIVAAVGSFMVGAGLGFLLAIVAIIAGGIGVLLSLSPSARGGIISFIAIIAGAIGILAAVVRLIL